MVTEGATSEDRGKVLELEKNNKKKKRMSSKRKIVSTYMFLLPEANFVEFVMNKVKINNSHISQTL